MRIFVIGATGATGQQIVDRGLTQGHDITALVRNPDKFEMQHKSLHVVKGDILDRVSLDAVQQQDAVISSLGTKKTTVAKLARVTVIPSWSGNQ